MPLLFKGKQDHLHSKAQINQHTNIWGIINVIQTKSDSRGPGQWKWMERLVSCWLSFTKPLPSSCKMMCILTKGTQLHILKTRAQVLWLEGTCSFHQHSDVTFSMHPPSLWWWRNRSCTFSSMEKKKKMMLPETEHDAFSAFEKSGFCSWQFLSKPCIPFYLSFCGLEVITLLRLKKMR